MNQPESYDESILMDFLKCLKIKLHEEENYISILDSMNEEIIDSVILKVKVLDKNKITKAIVKLSQLRITQSKLFANLIHKILQLPNDSTENDEPSWKNCMISLLNNLPAPTIRLIYENGDFTMEEILNNITDMNSIAFADIIPNYYSFAKDYPQVMLSREWILTGCLPGSLNALIKADDIDSVRKYIDQNNVTEVPIPEFEYRFYCYIYYFIQSLERTPLDVAAFYGAVKCFKYFRLIGYEVTSSTATMAVAGGNLEIFRICEQQGIDLMMCAKAAAHFCRMDLMRWFTEVKGISVYSRSIPSSILNIPASQLNFNDLIDFIDPDVALLKYVEEDMDMGNHKFYDLFEKVKSEDQIPIARAMLARGFDPDNLFTLNGDDEFFKFAMEKGDLKNALKYNDYLVTAAIANLGDELFEKLGEDGIWECLVVSSLAEYCKKEERLYKVIAMKPLRLDYRDWESVVNNFHKSCFELIPKKLILAVNIKSSFPYSKIQEAISIYKSLHFSTVFVIANCDHPAVFSELENLRCSRFTFEMNFFNIFAMKQKEIDIDSSILSFIKKCDTWDIVKNIIE